MLPLPVCEGGILRKPLKLYSTGLTVTVLGNDTLRNILLFGSGIVIILADPYLVLKDFGSYQAAQRRLGDDYLNTKEWTKKEIINVAKSGVFSSDRTIQEYNDRIWHLPTLTKKN